MQNRCFQLLAGAGLMVVLAVGLTACRSTAKSGFNLEDYPGKVRIACVGDSITYGAGIEGRETNCYPAVLGKKLGGKFEVQNFGVSGATLLKKGDKPYWNQPELKAVDDFKPDLVVIMLGTNDTKPDNWKHKNEFLADLRAMVEHFQRLSQKTKVWLLLPVPVYETRWGINDDTLSNEIIPMIKTVGQEKHAPVIDLYYSLGNRPDLFPDKVHPNAEGAALIAHTVEFALLYK